MLKIGDQYMVIEDTDDYIKITSGKIKGFDTYTVKFTRYLLKDSKVLLYNDKLRESTKTVKDINRINKAKVLGVEHCFTKPYEKYDENSKFNKLFMRFLAIGAIDIDEDKGSIEFKDNITDEDVRALNKNLKDLSELDYIVYDYCTRLVCKNVNKNVDIMFRVPNTNLFIGCK